MTTRHDPDEQPFDINDEAPSTDESDGAGSQPAIRERKQPFGINEDHVDRIDDEPAD